MMPASRPDLARFAAMWPVALVAVLSMIVVPLIGAALSVPLQDTGARLAVISLVQLFGAWALVAWVRDLGLADLAAPHGDLTPFSVFVATGFVFFAFMAAMTALTVIMSATGMSPEDTVDEDFTALLADTPPWALFLAAGVAAPVVEEVIFRGVFFGWLRARGLSVALTIAITSVVFTSFHVQYNWAGMLVILTYGVTFGWIRHQTGGVMTPIIAHSVLNSSLIFLQQAAPEAA